MITEQEIQKKFEQNYAQFLASKWESPLPEWLKGVFLKVVMEAPASGGIINYKGTYIHAIVSKSQDEFTFFEISIIAGVLLSATPKLLTTDLSEYIGMKITLEGMVMEYNSKEQKARRKAETERDTSMRIMSGGHNNSRLRN